MEALGMVELNSVAQGIATADAILKAANVRVRVSQSICPGKYVVICSGAVADVAASVSAGVEQGGVYVIDSHVIPRIHPDVFLALSGCVELQGVQALGIIEAFSVVQALISADEAIKSADVQLMEIRLAAGLGGKAFVLLTGSVSSVRAALDAALSGREEGDMLCNGVLIPAPHADVKDFLV